MKLNVCVVICLFVVNVSVCAIAQNAEPDWRKQVISTTQNEINLSYQLPSKINTINFNQFPQIDVPKWFSFNLGFGAPFYKDLEVAEDGKLNILHQGITGLYLASSYKHNQFAPENQYAFEMTYGILQEAAHNILRTNNWNQQTHGDIRAIAESQYKTHAVPYENVTPEGAVLLGKHSFLVRCCGNSADDTANYNIPRGSSAYMMDEESMNDRHWKYGSLYDFLGYVNQGMQEAAAQQSGEKGSLRLEWYAKPISYFPLQNYGMGKTTVEQIIKKAEDDLNQGIVTMGHPVWKKEPFYSDVNGGYFKVPGIDNRYPIYQKDAAGNFVLKNGKRVFRNEDFTVEHFGKIEKILHEPDDKIKYLVHDANGREFYGKDYVDFNADGSVTPKAGFSFSNITREKAWTWEPETAMFVDGMYRKADTILWQMLKLRHNDKGDFDISRLDPTAQQIPSIVARPRTEPWTAGGNSVEVREIGEDMLEFEVLFPLLSGVRMYSTWDDGYPVKDLPLQGQQMYKEDRNWSHYIPILAAYQSVFQNLQGTNPLQWRYLHFYLPFAGRIQRQVISSGIYADNKLLLMLINPSLENNEIQKLTLKAGKKYFSITLKGRELKYLKLDVPTNLDPSDFLLHQTNIYGEEFACTGILNNDFRNHLVHN